MDPFTAEADNYFGPRATLRLYLCLEGQIKVKKDNSKLKNDLRGPDVARGPYVAPSWTRVTKCHMEGGV